MLKCNSSYIFLKQSTIFTAFINKNGWPTSRMSNKGPVAPSQTTKGSSVWSLH